LSESSERTARRWKGWNLLLLVPLVTLVTPWFNSVEPRLFGIPFFYWFQLAWVVVGVGCVVAVNLLTREQPTAGSSRETAR
jgi:hypothetical protein